MLNIFDGTYEEFLSRYTIRTPLYIGQRVIWKVSGYINVEELLSILKSRSIMKKTIDVLELPLQNYSYVDCEAPEEYFELLKYRTIELKEN
jgi:hypothetical protein